MNNPADTPQAFGLTDADRSAIQTFYRAFSESDPDLLDQAVTSDWQDVPLAPGQAPGRDGMKPLIRGFARAFPDAKVTIHEIFGSAGRAGVRAEITATQTGEWFGVPPSGRSFAMALHEFHHIENGRLTHTWHLEDWLGWMRQVGALPSSREATS